MIRKKKKQKQKSAKSIQRLCLRTSNFNCKNNIFLLQFLFTYNGMK